MDLFSPLSVTLLFVAVFALLQIPITATVGLRRQKLGVHFLDGGDEVLLKRMRAHGNFTETVPMALLVMAAAEISGAPYQVIWVGGISLLLGRTIHYLTLVTVGHGPGRAIGIGLTMLPLLVFSGCVLLRLTGTA
ncbi:MAG: MAPEG family protein [Roseibium sp.]